MSDTLKAFVRSLLTGQVANRFAMEHDSPGAMKEYLREHPDADRSNHSVKKQDKPAKADKPKREAPSEVDMLREDLKTEKDPEMRAKIKRQLEKSENTRGLGEPSQMKKKQDAAKERERREMETGKEASSISVAMEHDSPEAKRREPKKANAREEFEAALKKQGALSKNSSDTSAVEALKNFVAAANRLSKAWDGFDDSDWLNQGYPKGLPSFDEFADQLETWERSARKALADK